MTEPLIFELGAPGRSSSFMPECDVPVAPVEEMIPGGLLRLPRCPRWVSPRRPDTSPGCPLIITGWIPAFTPWAPAP